MKVIANERGFFGQIREVGDEFEIPDDTDTDFSWFTKIKSDGRTKQKDTSFGE